MNKATPFDQPTRARLAPKSTVIDPVFLLSALPPLGDPLLYGFEIDQPGLNCDWPIVPPGVERIQPIISRAAFRSLLDVDPDDIPLELPPQLPKAYCSYNPPRKCKE